jgi:hypothetical protein
LFSLWLAQVWVSQDSGEAKGLATGVSLTSYALDCLRRGFTHLTKFVKEASQANLELGFCDRRALKSLAIGWLVRNLLVAGFDDVLDHRLEAIKLDEVDANVVDRCMSDARHVRRRREAVHG